MSKTQCNIYSLAENTEMKGGKTLKKKKKWPSLHGTLDHQVRITYKDWKLMESYEKWIEVEVYGKRKEWRGKTLAIKKRMSRDTEERSGHGCALTHAVIPLLSTLYRWEKRPAGGRDSSKDMAYWGHDLDLAWPQIQPTLRAYAYHTTSRLTQDLFGLQGGQPAGWKYKWYQLEKRPSTKGSEQILSEQFQLYFTGSRKPLNLQH